MVRVRVINLLVVTKFFFFKYGFSCPRRLGHCLCHGQAHGDGQGYGHGKFRTGII